MVPRRREPLPALGPDAAWYRSALLPLPLAVDDLPLAPQHLRYPAASVHVSVAPLPHFDRGPSPEELAAGLRERALVAPTIRVEGLGCSSDTFFLRLVVDDAFTALRHAVEEVTGLRPSWLGRLRGEVLVHANVVRLDGPARWPGRWASSAAARSVHVPDRLELVRCDRARTDAGTQVLATVDLARP